MEENKIIKHNHNERVYNRGIGKLRSPERVERLEVDRVVKLCLDQNITSVLDIGTGSALFAETFHNHGIKVSGIDTNPDMITAAKKYLTDGQFHVAPAEKIPFKDNSFDLTFFGVVFHEVDDYLKALREAYRVSRLGTSILEWDYKQEVFGPPIEHRLKPEFIKKLAMETGYKDFQIIKLTYLVLYKFTR
jgi:ubiquinone/menaquinone biosynthesis C-methylase UbiE